MLKNKLWIVALFAALTMAFFGCTEADHGWEAPVEELDDNALQVRPLQSWAGIDLNHAKFNFAAGDVIQITGKALAANTVHISRNHQAWAPIWSQRLNPDEEFDSGKVTLAAADVSAIAGLNPAAMRLYGNTNNGTFIIYNITVTRGGEEIFNFYEIYLKDLKPGTTDPNVIFPDADHTSRSEAWITTADGANNSHEAALFTILGPGFGGAAATPIPEYKGDPTKVVFTAGATAALDKVEDLDPSVTGSNVSVSSTGVVTFNSGSITANSGGVVRYKFPSSYITGSGKKAVTNPLALESDYDLIAIEYELSNFALTTGTNFKTKIVRYDGGWDGTAYEFISGGNWADLGGVGARTLNVQTWGANGGGGIEIHLNAYDTTGKFDFKITKVTFTKGTRYTVRFQSPQSGYAGSSQTVLSGNPARLPTLSLPGWTFNGWYDTWNQTDQNGDGTPYTASTAITANTTLYAKWLKFPIPAVETADIAITASLFSPVGSYDDATTPALTYAYDNGTDTRAYWIVSQGTGQGYSWTSPVGLQIAQADYDLIAAKQLTYGGSTAAYTRLGFDLSTLSTNWSYYSKVTITYDFVVVDSGDADSASANNARAVEFRNSATAAGGQTIAGDGDPNATPWLEAGIGNTITYTIGNFSTGWIGIVNNNNSTAKLLRISKVELVP